MSTRKCTNCGGNLYVVNTESKQNGLSQIGVTHRVIRRRLVCGDCEKMFTTYEIEAQDLTGIRNTHHDIRKKARLSKTIMGRLGTAIRHCQEDLERVDKE